VGQTRIKEGRKRKERGTRIVIPINEYRQERKVEE
jgi:hypothetical protein